MIHVLLAIDAHQPVLRGRRVFGGGASDWDATDKLTVLPVEDEKGF